MRTASNGLPCTTFTRHPPICCAQTSPSPVRFSTSATCAIDASSNFDLRKSRSAFVAIQAAYADAPLRPNPLLSGSLVRISTASGESVNFRIASITVGNLMRLPLKSTTDAPASSCDTLTSTPSDTVKPQPSECAFAGSGSAITLKMPDTLPGAKARATPV